MKLKTDGIIEIITIDIDSRVEKVHLIIAEPALLKTWNKTKPLKYARNKDNRMIIFPLVLLSDCEANITTVGSQFEIDGTDVTLFDNTTLRVGTNHV